MKYTTWLSLVFLATLSCLIPLSVKAQVTPDGTTSTTVNQDGNNFTIEQGDRVGDNLFHSFNQFSVPTAGSAAFNNAGDIANIFSRVTGNSISNIDGLISANGAANLFLINPNGIIFGENASLNLGGSFFASTADSLLFEGNTEFSAVNPQAPPLLEVSIPIGASFRDNPGDITVQSISTPEAPFVTSLDVKLVFLGGSVSFEGAEINALGRTVELGGLATAGTIILNSDLSLSFPNNVTRGDVVLNNGAFIDVSSSGGGNININARNLELSQGNLFAGIRPNEGFPEAQAGNVNINTTGEVNLRQDSSINNSVYIDGTGNSGDININTDSLNLTEGSIIDARTFGKGNVGSILIDADNNISIDGVDSDGFVSGITNGVDLKAVGNAGEITIRTSNLSLNQGGGINSNTFGNGDAGAIFIDATNNVLIDGTTSDGFVSGIFSGVETDGLGNGGEININATNLSITNGALIDVTTSGRGNAGSIAINAKDNISIDGRSPQGFASGISNRVETTGVGNAGNIKVTTSELSLTNNVAITTAIRGNGNAGEIDISTKNLSIDKGSQISASTFGQGNAGDINIIASDSILVDGIGDDGFASNISSSVADKAAIGNGGEVNLNTANLTLTNGGQISASTFGDGNAGGINIKASDTISANETSQDGTRSGVFSLVEETAQGNAGEVEITTDKLSLTNEGTISASTFGTGNASNVRINATDSISVDGANSGIFSIVNETAVGDAGGIEIATGNLTLTNGGVVNASTSGEGNGGGININATDTISAEGTNSQGFSSGIFSTVDETADGDAGGIEIATGNLTLTDGAEINAITFGKGDAGEIKITAFDTISVDGKDNKKTLTGIYSTVENTAIGNASGIEIDSVNFNLINTGQISSSTFGKGNAGTIKINAFDTIVADGARAGTISGIFSRVDETAEGNAGGIEITTDNLTLSNEGGINVGIFGKTNPELESGNLNLTVQDLLILRNSGTVSAQAVGNNNGGNLTINADDGLI